MQPILRRASLLLALAPLVFPFSGATAANFGGLR